MPSTTSAADALRFFRTGATAPSTAACDSLRGLPEPEVLFDADTGRGPQAQMVAQVRRAMAEAQHGATLPTGDDGTRAAQLLQTLHTLVSGVEARLEVLRDLGAFQFSTSETPAVRRKKLRALVTPQASPAAVHRQARLLYRVWRPAADGFLDRLLHDPADAARAIVRRMDRAPLGFARHEPDAPQPALCRSLAASGAVAYRREATLCLLGGVDEALRRDAAHEGLSPLHLLLLHEIATDLVAVRHPRETTARVVAGAWIRVVAGEVLNLAIEEFSAEWASREVPEAPVEADATGLGGIDPEAWTDCVISAEDLRPEAFVERTYAEQKRILREMFGDDWTEEDEKGLAVVEVA